MNPPPCPQYVGEDICECLLGKTYENREEKKMYFKKRGEDIYIII
jgi:hypothetical protein